MNWITVSGIILIATGTFLTFFGQSIKNKFDDKHLLRSVSEKPSKSMNLSAVTANCLLGLANMKKACCEKIKSYNSLKLRMAAWTSPLRSRILMI